MIGNRTGSITVTKSGIDTRVMVFTDGTLKGVGEPTPLRFISI
jgi:hypothetical protein